MELSTNELVVLLDQVRLVSLDVVKRAVAWREARRTLERRVSLLAGSPRESAHHLVGLMYQGENYLVKMTSDLAFLDNSPAVQHYVDGQSSVDNPFMLPIDDEILEDKCLEAADRVRLEVKCAALVAMKPGPALYDTSFVPMGLTDLKNSDPIVLVDRARLVSTLAAGASVPLDRGFFTVGAPSLRGMPEVRTTCESQQELDFHTISPNSRHRFVSEPQLKFDPLAQGPGSPRSELPGFEKLRNMLKGRIEPKQHVTLQLVPQLPGNGLVGVQIQNKKLKRLQVIREKTRPCLRVQGIAALLIQRFFIFVRRRACKLLVAERNLVAFQTDLNQRAALLQACIRGKAVRNKKYGRAVVTKAAQKRQTPVVNTNSPCLDAFKHDISKQANRAPMTLPILKGEKSHRPELDPRVKKNFDMSIGFSAQLRKELAAKHIQVAFRNMRTQGELPLKKIPQNTDCALIALQAHVRSVLIRKNTNIDKLAGTNIGRRRARVDEAIASALRYATEDSGWDSNDEFDM